jgi:signal transduction histidine kinase
LRAHDGKLWWATSQGAAVVDPSRLTLHNQVGPIVIQNILADDRPVTGANPVFAPDTRRLEIKFAALSFAAADNIQFRYRLDSLDQTWLNADKRREAFFTKLAPGRYRFRVQASADGGITWTGPGTELAFSIRPHIYQTWWFLALCGVTLLVLIWLAFVWRRRQLEGRFRAVLSERVRVAGEIHDSLAQGFTSAAMLLDSLDRLVPPESLLRTRLKSIRFILGSSLADARSMIATLRGQQVEPDKLESALRKLVDRLANVSSAPIALDFGHHKVPLLSIAAQQELVRICQEALNNAIRHAKAKDITVKLDCDHDKALVLVVRDDGIGFDVDHMIPNGDQILNGDHTHFGLIGLAERAGRIGGKLNVRSQPGRGTEIELILPLDDRFRPTHQPSLHS